MSGAIAGIVIGVLLGVGLIALAVILVVLGRINPDFASRAKKTAMKPFTMISEWVHYILARIDTRKLHGIPIQIVLVKTEIGKK